VQGIHRGLGEPDLRELRVDTLDGGHQAISGERVQGDDRGGCLEVAMKRAGKPRPAACLRTTGPAPQRGNLADQARGDRALGHALGGQVETLHGGLLETRDLQVLDAAEGLLHDMVALLVRLSTLGADALQALARDEIDQRITAAQEPAHADGQPRIHDDQQGHQHNATSTGWR
jgi:hypothetical protein